MAKGQDGWQQNMGALVGGADLKTTYLSQFLPVINFNFSALDFSGISFDEVVSFIPQELRTGEVLNALRSILAGDLTLVLQGQQMMRDLYNKYGPTTSLYDAFRADGLLESEPGNGTGEEPIDNNFPSELFNLPEAFNWSQTNVGEISSPLYEIYDNGSWSATADTIKRTGADILGKFGVDGETRDALFEQIGATAFEKLEDEFKGVLDGLGATGQAVRDALDVKKMLSKFIGNMLNQIELGIDAVMDKNSMSSEEFDRMTEENVGGFREDAKEFLGRKFGLPSGSIVDWLSEKAFGVREVNSFEAMVVSTASINGGAKRDVLYGSGRSETFAPGADRDIVLAGDGDDVINCDFLSNDYFSGGSGFDTVRFSAQANAYSIERENGNLTVSQDGGFVALSGIERLQFADISLDVQKIADSRFADPTAAMTIFITGRAPTQAQYDARLIFSEMQYSYYANTLGVANPTLGPYEALGVAFARESVFAQKFFPGATNDAFAADAYLKVFGKAATASHISAFVKQVDYFSELYTTAGVDPGIAQAQARGAVVGQMVGYLMESPQSPLGSGVEAFLAAVASGALPYGQEFLL